MTIGKLKIIIDTNIWISFAIGKQLKHLIEILNNPNIEIFICQELIDEIDEVLNRPKCTKYVDSERKLELKEIILLTTIQKEYTTQIELSRDINDNFILALAHEFEINYIVTGDQDLLVLNPFKITSIISYNEFIKLLNS